MRLGHCMTALITPMKETGQVDVPALSNLVEKLIVEGCDGFVVCGTTAEASALSLEEKKQVLHCVMEQSDQRVCVWMGCGSNNTAETLNMIRWANTEPIDGIMLVCPYYVRPSQQGLYAHFAACARISEKPVMLYNVPKRTGVALSAQTVLQLAQDFPNIRALKQACHDMEMVRAILTENDQVQILSGEDGYFLEGLREGISGIVSVAGHCVMPMIVKIWEDYQYGLENTELDQFLKQVSNQIFQVSSPSDIKAMLALQGWCEDGVRLPLVPLSPQEKQALQEFMQQHSLL
ncbi:4-hydroxy-tetrahydrodipicolinate synthase [Holdemania massiliensis]|uniref:4-hydroxy-tetrahydrodipicolinate synthase n=1 Tax=Holdemania massiliensis TaxID=1468449 RepID=A0A6N7SA04_9FIRM|nr:4-hydroxy-tetrahydrodipicolinate synthase [Holdemania massiliensis]MSA72401.1 4-hydroxy-tetrahydrodipicolinate synthase [Holdemania massiliensis]MSA90677.1 4-hydroxy-tetrahydrodipicolinate synthase [Holdemania massiliensis]MSB79483.1 4-hydroxy-tetrahydrodipicolinate synthase [Holdemania massiliensis]MSC34407.1 4-hydroxy-tetrahydrodipicolinate synthase [Holdemania massiliensis]MSC40797.1 4-hydroxy-tetrahydrodipicolinate synthase [Holdemania massiliensis]